VDSSCGLFLFIYCCSVLAISLGGFFYGSAITGDLVPIVLFFLLFCNSGVEARLCVFSRACIVLLHYFGVLLVAWLSVYMRGFLYLCSTIRGLMLLAFPS
jgi:hypothetical protein